MITIHYLRGALLERQGSPLNPGEESMIEDLESRAHAAEMIPAYMKEWVASKRHLRRRIGGYQTIVRKKGRRKKRRKERRKEEKKERSRGRKKERKKEGEGKRERERPIGLNEEHIPRLPVFFFARLPRMVAPPFFPSAGIVRSASSSSNWFSKTRRYIVAVAEDAVPGDDDDDVEEEEFGADEDEVIDLLSSACV